MSLPRIPADPAVPLRRPRWMALLGAAVLIGVTARLGLWQLDRAAQKEARQTQLDTRTQAPPLEGAAALVEAPDRVAELHYRRITLEGHWRAEATLFLDNRPMAGRPGFIVVTPLRLADGRAVLVQRGWVPRDPQDRTRVPAIDTPVAGAVQLTARVAPWPSRLYDLGSDSEGVIRQNLDRDELARRWDVSLLDLSLQQLTPARRAPADPQIPDDGLLREWPLPAADVHKHYGYAAQWFGLAVLTLGLALWFGLWRPRRAARRP